MLCAFPLGISCHTRNTAALRNPSLLPLWVPDSLVFALLQLLGSLLLSILLTCLDHQTSFCFPALSLSYLWAAPSSQQMFLPVLNQAVFFEFDVKLLLNAFEREYVLSCDLLLMLSEAVQAAWNFPLKWNCWNLRHQSCEYHPGCCSLLLQNYQLYVFFFQWHHLFLNCSCCHEIFPCHSALQVQHGVPDAGFSDLFNIIIKTDCYYKW